MFCAVPQSGIADVDEDYDMQSEEELVSLSFCCLFCISFFLMGK